MRPLSIVRSLFAFLCVAGCAAESGDPTPAGSTAATVTAASPPAAPPAPTKVNSAGKATGCSFPRATPDDNALLNGHLLGMYDVSGDANSSDSVTNHGGPTFPVVQLQLIFWGNEWTTATSPSLDDVVASMQTLINSTYFSELSEYGFQSISLNESIISTDTEPGTYTSDSVDSFINNLISNGAFPQPSNSGPQLLPMVVMPPGAVGPSGECGEHADVKSYTFPLNFETLYFGYVSYGSIDDITKEISHETIESITDPGSAAWQMDRDFGGSGENEIADACNDTADYISDVYVNAYWSQALRSCVIPFPLPPTITSVYPQGGVPQGGTEVTIGGTNFDWAHGMQMFFGSTPVVFSCASSTTCTAWSPPGNDVVDVTVQMNDFTSAVTSSSTFAYLPSVDGLSEHSGSVGDTVTITGLGLLAEGTTVYFGPNPAPYVNCSPGPDCVVTVPAGSGTVHVTVDSGGGTSTPTNNDLFAYDAPVITSIEGNSGPMSGGTEVTIIGAGFDVNATQDDSTQLLFGGVPTTIISCYATTWCLAYTPAVSFTGTVPVVIDVYGTKSAQTSAAQFTFNEYPTLTVLNAFPGGSGGVGLDGYAPAGGAAITLTSSDPKIVVVPSPVTVLAGESGAAFSFTINPAAKNQTSTITATYEGSTVTTTLQIEASPPISVQLGATTLPYGGETTGTVTLLKPAPSGGAVVDLTTVNGTDVVVKKTVTVPAGQYSATFDVTSDYDGTNKVVTIDATYDGNTGGAVLSTPGSGIKPPPICPGPACI